MAQGTCSNLELRSIAVVLHLTIDKCREDKRIAIFAASSCVLDSYDQKSLHPHEDLTSRQARYHHRPISRRQQLARLFLKMFITNGIAPY